MFVFVFVCVLNPVCRDSNFERFLFHMSGNDSATLKGWMQHFEATGEFTYRTFENKRNLTYLFFLCSTLGELTASRPLLEASQAEMMSASALKQVFPP